MPLARIKNCEDNSACDQKIDFSHDNKTQSNVFHENDYEEREFLTQSSPTNGTDKNVPVWKQVQHKKNKKKNNNDFGLHDNNIPEYHLWIRRKTRCRFIL